jgi:hypothetical protein
MRISPESASISIADGSHATRFLERSLGKNAHLGVPRENAQRRLSLSLPQGPQGSCALLSLSRVEQEIKKIF